MISLIERRDMMAPRNVTFDDFVEVEYIENSSYAYIDTKYIPTNNTKIETKLEVTSYKEEWGEWLFGVRKDSSNQQFALLLLTASDKKATWTFAKTRATGNTLFNENVAYTISNNKNVLTVTDGTNTETLTATNSTFTSPVSMYIFNLNNNGSLPTSNSALIKLYYFKIYSGQTLIRDFIPVLQVSTRRYGLWDKVEGKFYTSPNGMPFSGKLYYDSEVQYLRSTGTQYMTFPLSVSAGTYFSFEGKVMPLYSSSSKYDILAANPSAQFKSSFYSRNTGNTTITYASTIGNESGSGGWGGRYNRIIDFKLSTEGRTVAGTEAYTELIRPLRASISQFRIFGGFDNTNRYPIAFGRVRIIAGDDILYDLIPVRVGNVGYMYDKLTNVLHQNEGTGNFTLGPDVG